MGKIRHRMIRTAHFPLFLVLEIHPTLKKRRRRRRRCQRLEGFHIQLMRMYCFVNVGWPLAWMLYVEPSKRAQGYGRRSIPFFIIKSTMWSRTQSSPLATPALSNIDGPRSPRMNDALLVEQEKVNLARFTEDSRIMFQDASLLDDD